MPPVAYSVFGHFFRLCFLSDEFQTPVFNEAFRLPVR